MQQKTIGKPFTAGAVSTFGPCACVLNVHKSVCGSTIEQDGSRHSILGQDHMGVKAQSEMRDRYRKS